MNNRCPHFDEGILPMCRKKHVCSVVKTSVFVAFSLLILLPVKSLAIAPKYETAYACEGKTLTIECEPGDLINLIRANYGRFSITICNDHGNVDWSVNCMSTKSLRVLHSKCTHKQNCSVLASTNMFDDPCPGTHKYLEAHYTCISAAQTSTTTNRPSPPWLLTNQPSVWSTSTPRSSATGTTARIGSIHEMIIPQTIPKPIGGGDSSSSSISNSDINGSSTGGGGTEIHLAGRPPTVDHNNKIITTWTPNQFVGKVYRPTTPASSRGILQSSRGNSSLDSHLDGIRNSNVTSGYGGRQAPTTVDPLQLQTSSNLPSLVKSTDRQQLGGGGGGGGSGIGDDNSITNQHSNQLYTTQSAVLVNNNNYDSGGGGDSNYYCGPTTSRNLFWNVTKVGEVNVQPCPGGATGIAKWRCVFIQNNQDDVSGSAISSSHSSSSSNNNNKNSDGSKNCDQNCDTITRRGNSIQPAWHPVTPDLTQCRSLWLNSLEIRVNQRDSSLISIANDLSQVTSSKTLYGGDMLVTTKIIQTMSEKMSYDIETFPDQRQREAIIFELLHGVVKTGSNLLDLSQHLSWLDLSFEDQMRVATSLLTGLEDNAFLLADTIIRERNVVQKVKNILLSVRVLETRNIISNEIFPDAKLEQWQVSDDQIELPRGALIENSEGGLVRIVFVAFDRLEAILKPSYDNLDIKFSTNYLKNSILNQTSSVNRMRVLNSKVISASLGKGRHIQLSQPIRLALRHLKTENVTNPTCVFWNYIDHAWSEDGCYLESTNKTHTVCMCNHLTNFAILMDIVDEHNSSLLSMFDNNMRILIYISIAICILFIIIAILTLKLFNGIFVKSTRTSIYKNIYICLFIIEILFLLGIEQNETSVLCGFTTAFLHCFILSAIAWLFFEGFQLHATLTTDDMLLEVENSSKIIWYYLLSYGLAFTIVAISLAIDPSTYTQGDFCVLMEPNGLFYTTFIVPIILFVVGTIGYPILACRIMCKKSKTTLKNKEHTRLTSVKFDLRCSFLFLIILSIDWIFAYLYLRKAKLEEEISNTYGYLFITFNSLLGIYIFVFHCIQNEKIRREYRKYIRQNSWLPKCLRCSKTSISSSSASQHHHHHQQHYGTANAKKSPITLPTDPAAENIVVGTVKSSGNNTTTTTANPPITSYTDGAGSENYPTTTTTLGRQQHMQNAGGSSIVGSVPRLSGHRHNLMRTTGGTLRTSSGGHTSPTSSAGSTHLIFNSMQNDHPQDWSFQQSGQYMSTNPGTPLPNDIANKNINSYDDKFLYYDCKSKRLKPNPNSLRSNPSLHQQQHHPQQQQHEYFYWTEKNNKNKKTNGDLKAHKSDTVHTFYPSYKKTMMKHFASVDDEKLSDCDFSEIENERKYFRYPIKQQHQQQQQHQLSSDDDHAESHLIHSGPGMSMASSSHQSDCFKSIIDAGPQLPMPPGSSSSASSSYHHHHQQQQQQQQQPRQHYRHKPHSSCDLSNDFPSAIPGTAGLGGPYYNQSNCASAEEPVYEEILNSRMSEMCDDDEDDDDEEDDEDDDDVNIIMEEERYNRLRRMIANKEDMAMRQPFNRQLPVVNKQNFDFNPAKCYKKSPNISDEDSLQRPTQQQQIVSRNLSAMLDENNTVVCYLEPLPK